MSKISIEPKSVFLPQPVYIIGTYRQDNAPDFAPITWVSYTYGPPKSIVISMYGKKMTKDNIFRDGVFSANLADTKMVEMVDYFGSTDGYKGRKDSIPYEYDEGRTLKVPILKMSKLIFECKVSKTMEMPEAHTFIAEIKNILVEESLGCFVERDIDLQQIDPIIYSGNYYSVGRHIAHMFDYYKPCDENATID